MLKTEGLELCIKEEKDDFTLSEVSEKDLKNWDEYTKSLGTNNEKLNKSSVKYEYSQHTSMSQDPLGFYTLMFWYKECGIVTCPDMERRVYLNKKCVENAFTWIGKCFATCYEEEHGSDKRIVGCVSFEKESDALFALNDTFLNEKYNLEVLDVPSCNGKANTVTDTYELNLFPETPVVDPNRLMPQQTFSPKYIAERLGQPNLLSGVQRTIFCEPSQSNNLIWGNCNARQKFWPFFNNREAMFRKWWIL